MMCRTSGNLSPYFAHANPGLSPSIEFYDGFFSRNDTGRFQIALHESMHLFYGLTDINFAKAVGAYREGMTGHEASEAWNRKLENKCN